MLFSGRVKPCFTCKSAKILEILNLELAIIFRFHPSVKLRQATNHSANDHPFPWNNINTNKQKHGQLLLVVGFKPFGTYMPSPRRVEHKKYVKPPPKLYKIPHFLSHRFLI